MTTIAASKTQIAGDLQATHGGGMKFKIKTKLFTIEQPLVYPYVFHVGVCGNVDEIPDIVNWLTNPTAFKRPPKGKSSEWLCLSEDGRLFTFNNPSVWLPVKQDYYSIGSGSHFAMGAMESGKTPLEAVKLASKFDPMTGMGYKQITIV